MSGDVEGDISYRFGLAATVGVDLTLTNLIGLQARIGYIQKGVESSEHSDLGTFEAYSALSYAEFSALGRIGNGPVHGLLGTSVGIPVSCQIGGTAAGVSYAVDCSDVDVNPAIDIGLTVGIGTARWKGMFANLMFTEGLRDVVDDEEGRNRSLSLVIGVYLAGGER